MFCVTVLPHDDLIINVGARGYSLFIIHFGAHLAGNNICLSKILFIITITHFELIHDEKVGCIQLFSFLVHLFYLSTLPISASIIHKGSSTALLL